MSPRRPQAIIQPFNLLFFTSYTNIGLQVSAKRATLGERRKGGNPNHFPSMKVELIEKAAQIVGDNQLLVNIVSQRVQQLNKGADPYVPTTPETGSGDIALMEIIEGKITWRAMTDEDYSAGSDPDGLFDELFSDSPEAPATEEDRTITATIDL